jgi:predicted alpha-1,6-mannanase (GH76 family)
VTSGDLPLCFQFSGTVFYQGEDETLQVAPISWDKEAKFRLPVKVWKDLMHAYYPNSTWLALHKDAFEKLCQFKVREGIPTWEEALERALNALPETVRP